MGIGGSGVNTLPSRELSEMHQWLHRSKEVRPFGLLVLIKFLPKTLICAAQLSRPRAIFLQIRQNRLVVKFKDLVGEEFNLDSSTLPRIFGEAKIDNLLNQNRSEDFEPNRDEFSNVSYYYKAYVGTQGSRVFDEVIDINPKLGRARIRLLLEEGAPRSCLFLRNDMAILDTRLTKQSSFSMRNMGDCAPWCAVVEFEKTKTNEFIRSMEPVAHDSIDMNDLLSRVGNDQSRENEIRKDVEAIRKAVKDFIREKAAIQVQDTESIDWMNPTGDKSLKNAEEQNENEFANLDKNSKRSFNFVGVDEGRPSEIKPVITFVGEEGDGGGGGGGGGGGVAAAGRRWRLWKKEKTTNNGRRKTSHC